MCNIVSHQSDFFTTRQIENARPVRLTEFETWRQEAEKAGYRTRKQMAESRAWSKGSQNGLHRVERKQTGSLPPEPDDKPQTQDLATDSLIDRFVVRTDIFGYLPHGCHHDWRQMSNYRWDVRSLIRQGFNHRRCHRHGITMGEIKVQAFSVRCGDKTDFFVIDLDCHEPTTPQVAVHLELVRNPARTTTGLAPTPRRREHFLPIPSGGDLWHSVLGHVDTAVRYRTSPRQGQEVPAWARCRGRPTSSSGRLTRPQAEIEIKPTETQQVSMPGCYGKTVFTDRELKLVDGWFDVIDLDNHIQKQRQAGDVFPRLQGTTWKPTGNLFSWARQGKTIRPSGANGYDPTDREAVVLSFEFIAAGWLSLLD